MYNSKEKKFMCNNCNKVIETGEKCWVKWNFPPSHLRAQMLPRKSFELDNVPIICSVCSREELLINQF